MVASPLLPALALLLGAGPSPAALLAGKEVLRIDHIPGKMGAVTFKHAEHALHRRRPDGSAIGCRDCHHDLARDPPESAAEVRRCGACHAGLDEPPRKVDGRLAPPLVARKPEGPPDYRTVLFHAFCRDCHRKSSKPERKLHYCKVCHERGVGEDVIHGDPAPAQAEER